MRDFTIRVKRKLRRLWQKWNSLLHQRIARVVYSLPMLRARDPRRRVVTVRNTFERLERFATSSLRSDWFIQLREAQWISREPSISLSENEAAKFASSVAKYQGADRVYLPEAILACIHSARVEPVSFVVSTREGRPLLDSTLSSPDVLEGTGVLNQLRRPRPRRINHPCLLLAHPWCSAYYHWMIEVLPKLSVAEQIAELNGIHLIVPHPCQEFQLESLRLAGVDHARLLHLNGEAAEVEELYLTEFPGTTGSPSPEAVRWLRKTFLSEAHAGGNGAKRRIYLTRRDVPKRRLLNEQEVVSFLQRYGFEVVCPGELTLAEQITLFAEAEIVVAPHGAALTNLVFSPPGTLVIELFGENYINGCFWALANLCDQTHAFILSPTSTLDFQIPVERIEDLFRKLGVIASF